MGHCYTKQEVETFRNSSNRDVRPQKCILLENPYIFLIQLSDGSVENISLKNLPQGISLNVKMQSGIYFGTKNKIYFIIEAQNYNDSRFLQFAHAYYLAKSNPQENMIEPQNAYLVKHQKQDHKFTFIIQSKSLGEESASFVDLIDLGRRLKEKQICWQDMQFKELILQFSRKYSKISKKSMQQISNIIVGSDGSVHLLGVVGQCKYSEQSYMREIQNLQQIWLTALYGTPVKNNKNEFLKLQAASQFKHPDSLEYIQDLARTIQEEKQKKYERISNPYLKFIKDYITAYNYKFNCYNQELLDTSIKLKQWRRAQEVLTNYMEANNSLNAITEDNYVLYLKLLEIESIKNRGSHDYNEAKSRVQSAASYLADRCKEKNQYGKSYKYYKECMRVGASLNEQFYFGIAEVSRALNLSNQIQQIYNEAMEAYPNSRIIQLCMIIHLCDCMRVEQAERLLNKATPDFRTLELELSWAKLYLTKAVLNPSKKLQFTQRARDSLSNVVIQRYLKQTNESQVFNTYAIPLYHELMGDSFLQQSNFIKAAQSYRVARILLKNQSACGYRISNIIAAQANCALMQKNYIDSITLYNQAIGYLSGDCKNMLDSIIGNRAIAKIKNGNKQQGIAELQHILREAPPQALKVDYNYIFLSNYLKQSIKN